jgi:hypothetical protein
VSEINAMVSLAKAMFSHEAGVATPLHDDQITFSQLNHSSEWRNKLLNPHAYPTSTPEINGNW